MGNIGLAWRKVNGCQIYSSYHFENIMVGLYLGVRLSRSSDKMGPRELRSTGLLGHLSNKVHRSAALSLSSFPPILHLLPCFPWLLWASHPLLTARNRHLKPVRASLGDVRLTISPWIRRFKPMRLLDTQMTTVVRRSPYLTVPIASSNRGISS